MIQDKMISALSSVGSVGQALTYAQARQDFKAKEEERKKVEAAEAAEAEEFKNIQESLKGVRGEITSELGQITKDEKGKLVYPESLKKDMQALDTTNWTLNKLKKYQNQFAEPETATSALDRLKSYSDLIQQQRKFFKGNTEMINNLEQAARANYRLEELKSIKNIREPKPGEGGK